MITMKDIEEQMDATIEVARTGTATALLKSTKKLSRKLEAGVKVGLTCNEQDLRAKFAVLQKIANGRKKKGR